MVNKVFTKERLHEPKLEVWRIWRQRNGALLPCLSGLSLYPSLPPCLSFFPSYFSWTKIDRKKAGQKGAISVTRNSTEVEQNGPLGARTVMCWVQYQHMGTPTTRRHGQAVPRWERRHKGQWNSAGRTEEAQPVVNYGLTKSFISMKRVIMRDCIITRALLCINIYHVILLYITYIISIYCILDDYIITKGLLCVHIYIYTHTYYMYYIYMLRDCIVISDSYN